MTRVIGILTLAALIVGGCSSGTGSAMTTPTSPNPQTATEPNGGSGGVGASTAGGSGNRM